MANGRALTDEQKEAVMRRILEAWKRAPMLRLGQLIDNSLSSDEDVFFTEDAALASSIEHFVKRK